jgi:hypothetical protein
LEHVKAEVKDGTLNLGFDDGLNLISPTQVIFVVGVDDLKYESLSSLKPRSACADADFEHTFKGDW